MSKEFTHLSLASAYSFKYGSSHPEQLVQRAAQFNMKSLAKSETSAYSGNFISSDTYDNVVFYYFIKVVLTVYSKWYFTQYTLICHHTYIPQVYFFIIKLTFNNLWRIIQWTS